MAVEGRMGMGWLCVGSVGIKILRHKKTKKSKKEMILHSKGPLLKKETHAREEGNEDSVVGWVVQDSTVEGVSGCRT